MIKLTIRERLKCLLELILLSPFVIYCIWNISKKNTPNPNKK